MGALASSSPTLLDIAKAMDPMGKISAVAEVLNHHNEILDDMTWKEGNLPTGHQVTLRKSIPAASFRLFNQGLTPVKATTGQNVETCAMMANYSQIDKDLAMLNGNTAAFRMSQDKGILEGFNQTLASTLIYGDTTVDPEKFVGLAPRYYSSAAATVGTNVIKAGGSSNANSSIWLVGWSPETVYGVFPKGSQAGFTVQDLGEQTVYDANNLPFQAYRTYYQWKAGIAVEDWRYVVRIANIDIANLETASDSTDNSANVLKYMSMALDKLYNISGVRPVFYANQRVRSMLRVKFFNKSNALLSLSDVKGASGITRPTLMFQGYPVRRCDEILNTESNVA